MPFVRELPHEPAGSRIGRLTIGYISFGYGSEWPFLALTRLASVLLMPPSALISFRKLAPVDSTPIALDGTEVLVIDDPVTISIAPRGSQTEHHHAAIRPR